MGDDDDPEAEVDSQLGDQVHDLSLHRYGGRTDCVNELRVALTARCRRQY